MRFVAADDPNRCPSRVIYRGRTRSWCAFPAGHEEETGGRHHNGTMGWTDQGKGVQRTKP